MKKKFHKYLILQFVSTVFGIFLVVTFAVSVVFYLFSHFDLITLNGRNDLFIFIILSLISVFIGTLAFLHISKRLFKPIETLQNSMEKVSDGDFSIRLNENQQAIELRNLYANFNNMTSALESTETLRNDFVSNVSHEFKTPLSVIKGYTQLLQQNDLTSEERQVYYQRILDSTTQLATLSEHILSLTKLETQVVTIEKNPFYLDEQIREIILFLQPNWESKQLNLELDLPPTLIIANEELLYQVWLNLLDNSIKYSQIGGLITVDIQQTSDALAVLIQDAGQGISAKNLPLIFDKFYQEDVSRQASGNGLGLALAKKITDIHGFHISITSTKNQGTKALVTMPLNTLV